jgi:hypothetical protein
MGIRHPEHYGLQNPYAKSWHKGFAAFSLLDERLTDVRVDGKGSVKDAFYGRGEAPSFYEDIHRYVLHGGGRRAHASYLLGHIVRGALIIKEGTPHVTFTEETRAAMPSSQAESGLLALYRAESNQARTLVGQVYVNGEFIAGA